MNWTSEHNILRRNLPSQDYNMEELIYQWHLGSPFPKIHGAREILFISSGFYLIGRKRKRPLFTFGVGEVNFANKKMKYDMAKNFTDRRQTSWLLTSILNLH